MVEMRNVHKSLVEKPERKGQFVRPRSRWQDNIKVDITEIGYPDVLRKTNHITFNLNL
jgi:hypothetical protein